MRRFSFFAWVVLAYNLAVIAWGAFVRASGSGAGCGRHWPMCKGVVVPRAPSVATLIEFSHRVTSGLALLLVVGLVVAAYRGYPKGHAVRRAAGASLAFIFSEALVGAGLVLLELVAHDASLRRAVALPAHLVNTFFLLAALSLTAWWSTVTPRDAIGPALRLRGQGGVGALLGAALAGTLLLGVTGAVTALGDTLFPAGSLAEGMRQDFAPTAHVLLRLRVWHPTLAVAVGLVVLLAAGAAWLTRDDRRTQRLALAIALLFVAQLAAGVTNLLLLAPVWMQIIHLLLADAVWITLVLLTASAMRAGAREWGKGGGEWEEDRERQVVMV
ncbi:MAG: COX15/CtaA family protein [Gemmatimonadaceae bacterium]